MNRPRSQYPPSITKKAFRRMLSKLVLIGGMLLTTACTEPVGEAPHAPTPPNPPTTPEVPDTPDVPDSSFTFVFATPEEGAAHLGTSDTFTQVMSPLDRNLRLGQEDVSEGELLEYVSKQTLAWTPGETRKLSSVAQTLAESLKGLQYALPEEVLLIKTSGEDELASAYTRRNAIIFPENYLAAPKEILLPLLAHELFHVLSRTATPAARDALYEIIGFTRCSGFEYPVGLADIKLTNPDGVAMDHTISTSVGDVLPVLFVPGEIDLSERKNPGQLLAEGTLQFKMIAVDNSCAAVEENGEPSLYDVGDLEGFFEQVGENTDYIIHPDEILADNFALLLTGVTGGGEVMNDIPNPEIPEAMGKVLGLN